MRVRVQLESVHEAVALEQEGWRAAVAERARRELGEREAALRSALTAERDEQIQVGQGAQVWRKGGTDKRCG